MQDRLRAVWGLNEEFKPQHNETILLLQDYKVVREEEVNGEEWMGYLKIKANECEYKEIDTRLEAQLKEITNEVINKSQVGPGELKHKGSKRSP